MKLVKVDIGPMDTYWFPDEGKAPEDVSVAIQWSPYGGQLSWAFRPFAPACLWTSGFSPVQYPGRTHAVTKRQAERLALELFTTSVSCLKLDHDQCVGRLASEDDWPDAPACPCKCHRSGRWSSK